MDYLACPKPLSRRLGSLQIVQSGIEHRYQYHHQDRSESKPCHGGHGHTNPDFIDSNKGDGKPFFAYLSYIAPHDPLHAPSEYIEKYGGSYMNYGVIA